MAETSALAISGASLMVAGGSRRCSLVEPSSSLEVSGDGAGRLATGVGAGREHSFVGVAAGVAGLAG